MKSQYMLISGWRKESILKKYGRESIVHIVKSKRGKYFATVKI